MIATPLRDYAPRPLRRVTLIKNVADDGLPSGTGYSWTYTLATREQAVARARLALRRDHPAEHVERWEVQP